MREDQMECKLVHMAALGRRFQLGQLYNYKTDQILIEHIAASAQVNADFYLKIIHPDPMSNKWEHISLSKHLQLGILAGLVDESQYGGSRTYLMRHNNPHKQAEKTLVFRTQSRVELLDLPTLQHSVSTNLRQWDATHVVVGIVYGAEAYVVLSQELDNDEEEAEENLSRLVTKLEIALEDYQSVSEFKGKFAEGEKQLLNRLKCRFYSDLHTQAVRECTLLDAYSCCLKLIREIKNPEMEMSNSVPITVFLCPLKVLMASSSDGMSNVLGYRDVGEDLVDRCFKMWTKLEKIRAEADAIRDKVSKIDRPVFRQFNDAILKFQNLLKNSLKEAVVKAREENGDDEAIEMIVNIAEGHPLFGPTQLERWLNFKKAELEIVEILSSLKRIEFMSSKIQLEQVLTETFSTKFALVLSIPSLDERTNGIIKSMTEYVEHVTSLANVDDKKKDELPWFMVTIQKKQVFAKVRELVNHVEKNLHLEKQVQFFIVPEESSKLWQGGCYSVYEADNLLKGNLEGLPKPPTSLQIDLTERETGNTQSTNNSPSICVKWESEYPGYPCTFLVQYRTKGSNEPWAELKTGPMRTVVTTQIVLNHNALSFMEFRVATDTCIGRSEFSDIVDTQPLIATSLALEKVSSEIQVTRSSPNQARFPPLMKDQGASTDVEEAPLCRDLSHQQPDFRDAQAGFSKEKNVGYQPKMLKTKLECTQGVEGTISTTDSSFRRKISTDLSSGRAKEILPKKASRIADIFLKEHSQRIIARGLPKIYLLNVREIVTDCDFRWYDIGRPETASRDHQKHKYILLMGATGCGKKTLIDGMVNYILDVRWEDPFRFKCVREDASQLVTIYTIHHHEGMCVPDSITIIDTPEYDGTNDSEISSRVTRFLKEGKFIDIDQIDAPCFVAASIDNRMVNVNENFIFQTINSILSNCTTGRNNYLVKVSESIQMLMTFVDCENPLTDYIWPIDYNYKEDIFPVAYGVKYNQFKNSFLYASHGKKELQFEQVSFENDQLSFLKFFASLEESLHHLDLVENIENDVELLIIHIENMEMFQRKLKECGNKNAVFQKLVLRSIKVKAHGKWSYNCNRCKSSCELSNYKSENRNDINPCNHLFCRCPKSQHEYQQFQWSNVTDKVPTTLLEMKAELESKRQKKSTTDAELLVLCSEEIILAKSKLLDLLKSSLKTQPKATSPVDYLSRRMENVSLTTYRKERKDILAELQQTLQKESGVLIASSASNLTPSQASKSNNVGSAKSSKLRVLVRGKR